MAHPDMDSLLDESLRIATHFLEKNGEFFPFGVTMDQSGEVSYAQGFTGDEHPPSQEVIELLISGFVAGAKAREYKATALVYDVRLNPNSSAATDAICVTIEHFHNEPVTCFLPYKRVDSVFEFGEIIAESTQRQVFVI